MKKTTSVILIIFLFFLSIISCSNNTNTGETSDNFNIGYNILDDNQTEKNNTVINAVESESLLILVNKENKLPDDYAVNLTTIENHKISTVLVDNLKEMQEAAEKDNIYVQISDAYRTRAAQEQAFDSTVNNFVNNGNSYDIAVERAKGLAAPPGYSEHETGLAIDFTTNGTYDEKLEMWDWLSRNAYKYGFILLYPKGKEDITGYDYEAWHYRYVGKDHAEKIFDSNTVLEEYLSTLQ